MVIRHLLSPLWAFLLFAACGGGSDTVAKAAAPTPTTCVFAPPPVLQFRFHTLQPGSSVNSQPLTGVFSTSQGHLCTAKDLVCLSVVNIRLVEPNLMGFGSIAGSVPSGGAQAALYLLGSTGVRAFTGTVTLASGQIRFDVTDGNGTALTLIGDNPGE